MPIARRIAAHAILHLLLGPVLVLMLLAASTAAFAHAVVTESSLRTEPVAVHKPTAVLLTFNSGVEPTLSQVFLVSKGDVHRPVPVKQGRRPGQIIVQLPPLDHGDYALRYKIFAADGHLTEDVIRFSVQDGGQ